MDGGQGLTPEAHRAHRFQIAQVGDFAGRMALECDGQLRGGNAHAVVFHTDEAHPASQQAHGDVGGTCVERVVHQLAHHGSRALHHLAGGTLADEFVGEFATRAWGLGSWLHTEILEAVIIETMEPITLLLDFILHIDRYIEGFVQAYGVWVYALLFLIIFVETGLVVMPFLPGDSLLFVVGAMCGVGLMDYGLSVALLMVAAVAGNQTNYTIGRFFGPKVFAWEDSKFFNRRAFDQAHAFYERYGGVTLVAARFMPFVRTFAPFVAGVAHMSRRKFSFFDVTGGALWVGGIVSAGYFFGNIPWVKLHLDKIIWAMILIPGSLAIYGSWKASRQSR